jgi:hypothetical protein
MCCLRSSIPIVLAFALSGCIADRNRDASAPEPATNRPAVGGGPRDFYPDWCSAYDAPVPPERSSLPPAGAPDKSTGLASCPPVVPPLNPPTPPAPSPPRPR